MPTGTWAVVKIWARAHWIVVAGVLLAGLAALVAVGRWLSTFRRIHQSVVVVPNEKVVTNRVGQSVGKWCLVEHLGEGGTADVYRGATGNQPDAAVKIIRTGQVSEEMLARFKREAEILETLRHPNVIQLIEFGEDGDAMYLVEELVSGGSLGDRLQVPGLSVEAFYQYYRPVLEAIAFAHDQGIVHRDIKPENVLLTEDGQVKLTDFGLAKAATSANVTTSNVLGTPSYMAPEQFSGHVGTPATDQFSLGVMAYEMLCGRLPFEGESVAELMAKRLQDPPSLSAMRGAPLPAHIEQTIMRMLSRRPEARYPNLHQVIAAMDGVRRGVPRSDG
jgi:serine/threonine-protein kinase